MLGADLYLIRCLKGVYCAILYHYLASGVKIAIIPSLVVWGPLWVNLQDFEPNINFKVGALNVALNKQARVALIFHLQTTRIKELNCNSPR